MTETLKILLFLCAGAAILGLALLAISLIITIIRAIMKKRIRVTVILMLVGFLMLIAGVFGFFKCYIGLSKSVVADLNSGKEEAAQKEGDGTVVYRVGEFSFTDDQGNVFDNASLSGYKYTIVNHWEPWCGPCKAELPDLEKIYEDYKDKGINMVGIYSEQEDAADVIAANGLTYPTVFIGDSQAFDVFQTGSVPATFVLDSEGKLVGLGLPEDVIIAGAGENPTAELRAFYDGVVRGAQTYDFWKEKLDNLLK